MAEAPKRHSAEYLERLLESRGFGNEDGSTEVKAYFDDHSPASDGLAWRLAREFGVEYTEWATEVENGYRNPTVAVEP